ncbi:MAG: hypothetical protein HRT40_00580 [Campylobacteraceae bacterium]|nr:hypothetical protein [Campylobacteraceae bacterium]
MFNIDFSTYYSIDTESNKIERQTTIELEKNVELYIKEHLSELYNEDDIREYKIEKNQSTEVINCLNNILKYTEADEKIKQATMIANRLLKKEIAAQKKIAHLNSELQKGGLIITHFTSNNSKKYFVITKVHFIDVLMESSFKKEKATPEKEHMLKTIIIPILNDSVTNKSNDRKALITDSTKSKGSLAASFWWNEFLEVVAITTDDENTNRAFSKFDSFLKNKFYEKNKMDYYSCRNSLIAYMKSSPSFTFDSAITGIMGDFTTLDYIQAIKQDDRQSEIDNIINSMKSLNKTKTGNILFDGNFAIDKKVIKSKMKKTIKLDSSMSLTLEDEIKNLRKKIIPDTDSKGKHLKIYSEKGYDEFKKEYSKS